MTAYATAALALLVVVEGARIASFAVSEMTLDPTRSRLQQLFPWRDTLGVIAAARNPGPLILDPNDPDQFAHRETQLESYLVARPMASSVWLELAELRYTTARPKQRIIDAISLSQLTGPYEGALMFRRATLSLLIWSDLPSEMRDRAARDVALAENEAGDTIRLRTLIAGRSAEERDDLYRRLLQVGGLPEHRLELLGLGQL